MGATEEECAFLVTGRPSYGKWEGNRVELNAMPSDVFVQFVEDQLTAHGVQKVVPDEATLHALYRRMRVIRHLEQVVSEAMRQLDPAQSEASIAVPDQLAQQVREAITGNALAWETALWRLTEEG